MESVTVLEEEIHRRQGNFGTNFTKRKRALERERGFFASVALEARKKDRIFQNFNVGALNDNGINVDHLGHDVYAEALANQIEIIKPPLTIGLFARWGSGKSFLLQHVQSIVSSKASVFSQSRKKSLLRRAATKCTYLFSVLFMAIVILLPILLFVFFPRNSLVISLICICIDLLMILVLAFASIQLRSFTKILLYAIFTKLPIELNPSSFVQSSQTAEITQSENTSIENKENNEKKNRRYIFVNYNAWQYAGCDVLWAGIVKALANEVEKEFGTLTTRLFRSLTLQTVPKPEKLWNHRHLCVYYSGQNITNLNQHQNEELQDNIRNKMTEYGSVKHFLSLEGWESEHNANLNVKNKNSVWVAEYFSAANAERAFKDMQHSSSDLHVFCLRKHCISNENEKTWKKSVENAPTSNLPNFFLHMKKYPRVNRILVAVCTLGVLLCAITILIVSFGNNIQMSEVDADSVEDIVLKVVGILPIGTTVLITVVKFAYAFYNSQQNRIVSALQGVGKNLANELGFMNKIKDEVDAIVHLIKTVELVYNISYKVVITIDDLDRVPLPKVKSVLESVNILLSDRMSPFICIIAIDSRVAIDCFAMTNETENRPTTNGHEYMKKIINLPFCLPEIDHSIKPMYIAGLIDELRTTLNCHEEELVISKTKGFTESPNPPSGIPAVSSSLLNFDDAERLSDAPSTSQQEMKKGLKFKEFLSTCRDILRQDQILIQHMQGNPRNIKRIFNIISVTASLIKSLSKRGKLGSSLDKQFAKDMLYWILLTDQWPFRMSYLLVIIEDADQRQSIGNMCEAIDDPTSLYRLYHEYIVGSEKTEVESHENLLCLDDDPDVLYSLLFHSKGFITKKKAKELRKFSINLDSNLRNAIALKRYKLYGLENTSNGNNLWH